MNGGSTRVVVPGQGARAEALTAVVEDLAGELSLRPLLERILRRSTELLGCDAGSICLVDEGAGVYRKEADIGIACQSGKVFPLTEGTTGAVVARRGPVIFEDYGDVPGGHVRLEDRDELKGVIGVPIWWRGAIVGSCVVFTRDPDREFVHEDAELLELFAKHAAIAITNARLHEAAESEARAEAAAAERNRMAREVHDTVAQGLVSVLLQIRAAQGSARRSDQRARGGAIGGRGRLRGDEAQRARTRPVTVGGTVTRRGARARDRVGEPHGRARRPPRDGG
jgi:GAF domain-containing protein